MCCCGYGHHGSCHGGVWAPHPGYRWRSGESPREEYRRILEEEHELLERRLRVLSKELDELRGGTRMTGERP